MTVADLAIRVVYEETDDPDTLYAIPFQFLSASQVRVSRTEDGVTLVLGSGYTIAGDGRSATPTGTVQLAAPHEGAELEIERVTERVQPTVYTNRGDFPSASHEDAADRAMMAIQEQDAVLDRALLFSPGQSAPELDLEDFAGHAIGVAADGESLAPLVIEGEGGTLSALASLALATGAALVGWIQSGFGAVLRTIRDKLRERVSVEDFGAVGDLVALGDLATDDAGAFNAAIAELQSRGGGILNCPGAYRVASTLQILSSGIAGGITFRGRAMVASIIEFDFDGTNAIEVNGCDDGASFNDYVHGGGFENITLRPKAGRTITNGVNMVGWRNGRHRRATIRAFVNNVHAPLRADLSSDVDTYNCIFHVWEQCRLEYATACNILLESGQGHALWRLKGNEINHAGADGLNYTGNGWEIRGNSFSYNGGWGARLPGIAGSSTTMTTIVGNEFDGNAEGGLGLGKLLAGEVRLNRFISRKFGAEEWSPIHVRFDPALGVSAVDCSGNFHRLDTHTGYAAATILYDGGDGSAGSILGIEIKNYRVSSSTFVADTTNGSPTLTGVDTVANTFAVGQTLTGTGIPSGTTIVAVGSGELTMSANATADGTDIAVILGIASLTEGSAAFSTASNRNILMKSPARRLVSDRRQYFQNVTYTQGWTTIEADLVTNNADISGWNTSAYYDAATGIQTVDHNGHLEVEVRAAFSDSSAATDYYVYFYRSTPLVSAGAFVLVYRHPFSTTAAGPSNRAAILASWVMPCLRGDRFKVAVQSSANRTAQFGTQVTSRAV